MLQKIKIWTRVQYVRWGKETLTLKGSHGSRLTGQDDNVKPKCCL